MPGHVVGFDGLGPEGLMTHGYNELGRISVCTITSARIHSMTLGD